MDRLFLARSPSVVAPDLLNKVLVTPIGSARIVEVEAYGGSDDPASHANRGPTPRSEIMFGTVGHLYVYLAYGMHWCANVVAHEPGAAGAVLLRAATPITGIAAMYTNRTKARVIGDLCSGPGKLCQALGINGGHNGADLIRIDRGVTIVDDGTAAPEVVDIGTRIGLSRGRDIPWRWSIVGSLSVSYPGVVGS